MRNLGTIYRFELKKILKRKLLWVTALICLVGIWLTVFSSLFGTYYAEGVPVESNYAGFQLDQGYRKALSGRPIDELLLRETVEAYSKIPASTQRYTLTDAYARYARPYSDIFNLIRNWTGMNLAQIQNWEPETATLYEARRNRLEAEWRSVPLTEAEREYWRAQEARIVTPLVYQYHQGYEMALISFLTIGVLLLLFIAISMPNLFADEHVRRTDQLILSSVEGRSTAYWGKLYAGITVSVIAAALLAVITLACCLGFYGTEGFETPLQIMIMGYSYPLSVGQACLIAYGLLIAASVPAAIFVMVLSELLRSGIAALAVSAGLIILGNMIMIPTQYRLLGQLWDWSPMAYLSIWNVFDSRTLTLFDHCFVSWKIVPVLYLLAGIAMAVGGKYIYRRYQVRGR